MGIQDDQGNTFSSLTVEVENLTTATSVSTSQRSRRSTTGGREDTIQTFSGQADIEMRVVNGTSERKQATAWVRYVVRSD